MKDAVDPAQSRDGAGDRCTEWPTDPVQQGHALARAAEQQGARAAGCKRGAGWTPRAWKSQGWWASCSHRCAPTPQARRPRSLPAMGSSSSASSGGQHSIRQLSGTWQGALDTGNEAYEMIKECSEAKQAKAKATLDKKAERAANKEARKRADNELGSGVWSDLCTLEREVDSLRVDEMRACLMHRAVPIPKGALKPALRALVATAIDSYVGPEDDGELASHFSESSSDGVQFENEQYSDASSLGDDSPYESDAS